MLTNCQYNVMETLIILNLIYSLALSNRANTVILNKPNKKNYLIFLTFCNIIINIVFYKKAIILNLLNSSILFHREVLNYGYQYNFKLCSNSN